MNKGITPAGQIQLIKQSSAVRIYEQIEQASKIVKLLDAPCTRSKNFKAKLICVVRTDDEAKELIDEVNRMAAADSASIESLIHQKRPAIRYYSSIVRIEDPSVRISVKAAETVWSIPMCQVLSKVSETTAIDAIDNSDLDFLRRLVKASDSGIIDLASTETVRLSRCSGNSYRIQAYADGRSMQQNVGDICVLVYEYPDEVEVVDSPRRKVRADAANYDTIVAEGPWKLSRYIIMD